MKSKEISKEIKIPNILPILPLRNMVIFPHQVQPLTIGREKSKALLSSLKKEPKIIGLFTQIDGENEDPQLEELYKIGIAGTVAKTFKMPDGSDNVIIEGLKRIRIVKFLKETPFITAEIEVIDDSIVQTDALLDKLIESCQTLFGKAVDINPSLTNEHRYLVFNTQESYKVSDVIASLLSLEIEERQDVLQTLNHRERLEKVHAYINNELQILEIENKIQKDVHSELHKNQREFVLKEQLKAIKKELGEDVEDAEIDELKARFDAHKLSEDVAKVVNKELKRLQKMSQMSGEHTVIRNYLEWIADLPWNTKSDDILDLKIAQETLDADHYGLEKVKKRIIEFLAVKKIKEDLKGPILCFYGPPGVGKTSLGRSIARALNRKFGRIALGGVSDEAEIRGHRKTYIGSMPGRIIRELKKLNVNNPVILLDEIDKISQTFKGDPASALLEVLDPEQNNTFVDHFLEVEFDLSKVLFIATANQLDTIPLALRDRMEIIDITGYIEEEKISIAETHLIPKQLKEHGLKENDIAFSKNILSFIISRYTREAGVRGLEKNIASVIRSITTRFVIDQKLEAKVTKSMVEEFLGPCKFENEMKERVSKTGVATGMAWTPFGGDILFFEATKMAGTGKLQLTGQLGDVMKESAQTAYSLLKSSAKEFSLGDTLFEKFDIHLHIPAGAIPKDGPSAGITMFTTLYSIFSGHKVKNNVAMTGEITLRGLVLPIGGLKEKVLAAKRAGITQIIAPAKNEKDLVDIPKKHLKGLEFFFVEDIKDVISLAMEKNKMEKHKSSYKQITYTEN